MTTSIEEILRDCFGCEKPVYDEPRHMGIGEYGQKEYKRITRQGWEAYGKLTTCIAWLEEIGLVADANDIIESLDDLIKESDAYYE